MGRPVLRRPRRGAGRAERLGPLRLAAGPVRPAVLTCPRPGAAPGRAARRRRAGAACWAPSTTWRPTSGRARSWPGRRTRTSTRRWSAAWSSGWASLGGKLRAGRSRNDQVATDLRLYLREAAREVADRVLDLCDALSDQAQTHLNTAAPGMTHLQHAQPIVFAHQLLAHVHAFARDLDRLADWDTRTSVSPLGAGALAGSTLPLDPEATAHELGFAVRRGQLDRRGERPRLRGRVPLRRRHDRRPPVPAGRGGRAVVEPRVPLGRPVRRLLDRVLDHAAEEEPRRRRAGPRQVRPADRSPDRPARHAEGPAAGLRPRPAGGQGAGLRRGRHAARGAARDRRHDRHDDASTSTCWPASAPEGFALATDVAEYLVRQGVVFREAHEAVGRLVVWCTEHGCDLHEVSDADLAALDPHLTPDIRSVLSVAGALAARSTPGRHRSGTGGRAARRRPYPAGASAGRGRRTGRDPHRPAGSTSDPSSRSPAACWARTSSGRPPTAPSCCG